MISVVSAGTTFNDVRIPFPHVCVTGVAARSTFEVLRGEHPTATPVIISGNHNSLRLLLGERPALPPEELIELSLHGDGRSVQLATRESEADDGGRHRENVEGWVTGEVLMGRGIRARSVGAGGGVRSGYAGAVSVAFEN